MSSYVISLQTSASATHVEAEAQPSTSEDGTLRVVVGCDDRGRGAIVTIQPLYTVGQFVLQSISLKAAASRAGPEDA